MGGRLGGSESSVAWGAAIRALRYAAMRLCYAAAPADVRCVVVQQDAMTGWVVSLPESASSRWP